MKGDTLSLDDPPLIENDEEKMGTCDEESKVVHLGYCVPIEDAYDESNTNVVGHNNPNWSLWDGGKVGGKPSWLVPQHMPKRSELRCCSQDMTFLVQLYCPGDEEEAFHRTMYVFVCPKNHTISNNNNNCGGVKVFRCQLPRKNPFYPYDCSNEENEELKYWTKHLPQHWNTNTCTVCGVFATGKCPLQNLYFCGKAHQKEHLKIHKSVIANTNGTLTVRFSSVYPEYELVVEDEPCEGDDISGENDQMKMMNSIKTKSLFSNDHGQEDASLEQTDLNKMIGGEGGGVTDLRTIEFYTRITRGGKATSSQCLRYCRWPSTSEEEEEDDVGVPLWISSDCVPRNADIIPVCSCCGSIRKPEFQIMPQMLNYIHVNNTITNQQLRNVSKEEKDATIAAASIIERNGTTVDDETATKIEQQLQELKKLVLHGAEDELNFGSIVVYTCTKSCNSRDGAVYMEEVAWRQPPLDEY